MGISITFVRGSWKLWRFFGWLLVLIFFYLYFYMAWFKIRSSIHQMGHSHQDGLRIIVLGDPQMEGDARIRREGKWWGAWNVLVNDYYERHIVKNILLFTHPTHVFVLGDIFSFQHLPDHEFNHRLERFNWIFDMGSADQSPKLINITGNHDIGYGAEITERGIRRWEAAFGPANSMFIERGHLFAILNSMNMDHSNDKKLQEETWNFLHEVQKTKLEQDLRLLLFFHVPLHKEAGHCNDAPGIRRSPKGAVIKQNMLSPETSQWILDELSPEVIFNGHDHYGCLFTHTNAMGKRIPEYTIRSMMGDFSGATGIFDLVPEAEGKQFEYKFELVHFVIVYLLVAYGVACLIWLGSAFLLWVLARCCITKEKKQ